ncbi:putative ion transporter superfamily protein YfcC [Lutibacter sp. Hel_I_33_5]|uniref:YfcC family protein n=1 Tax=Lutibacter sp. Hel_I_33_5 TaxID=1566289 RepID=UPI0011A9D323|nr:TIGR00366 family protein [Lutibacter sp. Hel_I_33_5]TVZ54981.1 putative ion transporter superfamily protein YfcC [Lutibacter sp. Hel_I_33_5]
MLKTKLFSKIPHALTILFIIIVAVAALTHIIPAGEFERIVVDGRSRVVPNSYHTITSTPISFFDMFKAIPLGFEAAVKIIFIVLAGGIMFGVMEKTKTIENLVGTLVRTMGNEKKYLIVFLMTFFYGFLGVFVGYEHNIAMVPIAAVLSIAIGGDLILAAGISVGAITIGFGLSPINPYTVGVGHKIAELPLFSGAPLRTALCFFGLLLLSLYNIRYLKRITKNKEKSLGKDLDESGIKLSKPISDYTVSAQNYAVLAVFVLGLGIILYGVFNFKWYFTELSAVFLMIAIACGLVVRMNPTLFSETVLNSIAKAAPGAFMVGFATTIKVLMDMGNVSDTISFEMANVLQGLPQNLAAIGMSISQSIINFFIPSGSGQALATLPVMIPLGEVLGVTRQTTILAFQIGDGVVNLINPTLGGLIAMLSMCRVPLDKWFKFILPVVIAILLVSWIVLIFATYSNY